jgi:hypothetical protein
MHVGLFHSDSRSGQLWTRAELRRLLAASMLAANVGCVRMWFRRASSSSWRGGGARTMHRRNLLSFAPVFACWPDAPSPHSLNLSMLFILLIKDPIFNLCPFSSPRPIQFLIQLLRVCPHKLLLPHTRPPLCRLRHRNRCAQRRHHISLLH